MAVEHPILIPGRCWGDEVCDLCARPADLIIHLTWPDGVDEDYRQSCFDHNIELAIDVVKAWRERSRQERGGAVR